MFFTATKRNRNRNERKGVPYWLFRALALAACIAVGFFPCALGESAAVGQSGLSGVVATVEGTSVEGVTLTLSQNGEALQTAVTDADGVYAFTGLDAGTFDLTLILPDGLSASLWTQVGVAEETDGFRVRGITLSEGASQSLNFTVTLFAAVQGTITKNGEAAAGYDVLLTGEGGEKLTAVTDETGVCVFSGLAAGAYRLSVPLSDNEEVETVNGKAVEAVEAASPYEAELTMDEGETLMWDIALRSVSTLRGVAAYLGEGQNVAIASVNAQLSGVTGADGAFAFTGLEAGDYTVYLPLPEGATLAEGSAWSVTDQGDMIWLTVNLAAGESLALPEADVKLATSIGGVAYLDDNGNRRYDEGEQLMSGVAITLEGRNGDGWAVVAETTTDAYGAYLFADLSAGDYRVLSQGAGEWCVSAIGNDAEAEMTLSAGDNLTGQSDIGLAEAAAVSVTAFSDSNENGERGTYERAVTGVTVEAVPAAELDGAAAGTAVTDAEGIARIGGLTPGEYVLRFTLPDGYLFTAAGDGWGAGTGCVDGNGTTIATSAALALASGETAQTGVGVIAVGSLSGRAWIDENNDGLISDDEPGLAGVRLTLTGQRTSKTYELTTNETGEYCFALLRNDTYTIEGELPEGYLFAHYTRTGGDARSMYTVEGTSASREFIVSGAENVTDKNVGAIAVSTLSGIAFMDTNYNGVYDTGEPPYEGVTIEVIKNSNDKSMGKVVTGADGTYSFTSLRGGDYRLRAILPDDGSTFTVVPEDAAGLVNLFAARDGRRENSIQSIDIENGSTVETCVGVALGGSISGTVYYDDGYDGIMDASDDAISGVKVQLTDENGEIVDTDTTNANGAYDFTDIMPGTYTVRFLRRDGYAFTRYRPNEDGGNWVASLAEDGYGETGGIAVGMGDVFTRIDAGMLPSSTLTGVFFDDLNDNGLMDEGEGGYTDGTVRLLSADGEVDRTVTPDADGVYFFDGVLPGEYTVSFLLPENAAMAEVTDGGNTLSSQGRENALDTLTVQAGRAYEAPLVGAVTLGSFEGYAFHDVNGNGLRDADEQAMADVTVTLTPRQTSLVAAQATSGTDGAFSITGLRPGTYTLNIVLPDGYIFSGDLTQSGLTLDTAGEDTLDCPWTALTNRIQNAVGAVCPATVSASVWLDENRNGAYADTERLMDGLTFLLFDETSGLTVKTARADANGLAVFENVRPSTYTVRFVLPEQSQPVTGGSFTLQGSSMVSSRFAVAEGADVGAISGGLVSYTSAGGSVVLDADGVRTVQSGVQVSLYRSGETAPLQTTSTDEQGSYRFDGLWPDEYVLTVQQPSGAVFVRPGDPNYAQNASVIVETTDGTGRSDPFTVQMADDLLSLDVILIQPARVGDQIWLDTNRNGLIDADEPTVNGVTVQLLEDGTVAYTTVSNEWGYYEFTDVYPGTYTIAAQAYPALTITKSVPSLRMISSCLTSGDGTNAQSDPFSVESGTKNFDFNLGYILPDGATMPAEITAGDVQHWPVTTEEE